MKYPVRFLHLTQRTERVAATLLTAAAFLLFCFYSAATPLFEASDELWHYPFVQHLATGGSLPVQHAGQTDADAPWRQEGSQPPLYYAFAALVSAPFDQSNWRELRRINLHADMGVPTADGNANAILHTPAENWPWSRAALAVRIARLVSIVMSTVTVAFAYAVAREIWREEDDGRRTTDDGFIPVVGRPSPIVTDRALLRLAIIPFTACIPMFAFISGAINNDNAAVMFSTMGLWWALRLVRNRDLSIKAALIAGLITALGALSKSSALGLLGLFGVAGLLVALRKVDGVEKEVDKVDKVDKVRKVPNVQNLTNLINFTNFPNFPNPLLLLLLLRFVTIMVVTVALLAGWWFVRNLNLYGDLLGWNAFLDVVGRRVPPANLSQLWSEREGFVWAYWGVFGTLNVIMPEWVYGVLDVMVIVAVIGWARQTVSVLRQRRQPSTHAYRAAFLCAFWIVLVFVALLRWTALTPASQGRLMFPCIAAIAAFVVYGLWRVHRVVLMGAAVGLIALAFAVPLWIIAPTYARPTPEPPMAGLIPINTTFGNAVALQSYVGTKFRAPSEEFMLPGDEVTLFLSWKLTNRVPKNYSVFVHLVDQNDVIVAQRDMYPGQGSLPLSELPVGFAWQDKYVLRLSTRLPTPKTLRWRVGLYDVQTGERLKIGDGEEFATFDTIELGPRPADAPAMLNYANGAQLYGYHLSEDVLLANTTFTATLQWTHKAIESDDSVSLQIIDEAANKIGSRDVPLPKSAITDTLTIDINKDAPPGVYRVLLVVYRPGDFAKVGAYDERNQFTGDQIELTKIRVR